MRNTLLMVGLLGAMAIFFFVFLYERDQSTLKLEEIDFAIEDTASIHQIVLTRMVKDKPEFRIQLDRQADGPWQLNGRHPAIQPKVQQLLKVLHLVQVKEVLTGEGLESAYAILKTVRTEVEVRDSIGTLIKSYLLGTENKDATGTLLQLAEAETPYIVEMPGLQGYINPYFSVDRAMWRANPLFQANQTDLQQIGITYSSNPSQSFLLSRSSPDSPWRMPQIEQTPDSARLSTYLAPFQGMIYAETFATEDYPGKLEELRNQTPDVQMSLGYFTGDSRSFVLFERAENPNNYFGWVEGEEELLTIQHFVIDKFLQGRSYLLGQDDAQNMGPTL